jgi:DNA-binding transcriptional regulator YiaG
MLDIIHSINYISHMENTKKQIKGDIRAVRARLNLTQKEFAELLGVVSKSIANWENDQSDLVPTADIYLQIIAMGK